MKKYLFVCKHNFTRSKRGAEFFRGYLGGLGLDKKVKIFSAGIAWVSIFLGRRINSKMVSNFDLIFVMENYMKEFIVDRFHFDKNKIVVLNIKDEYGFLRKKSLWDLEKKFDRINWKKYIRNF